MATDSQIEIGSHSYTVEGPRLVAERYDDGVELHIYATSNLSRPCLAAFMKRGPRGGMSAISLGGGIDEVEGQALRLMDARRHIRLVEKYRQEKWGNPGSSSGEETVEPRGAG